MGKSVKPENCIGYQANENQSWYALERERVVAAASTVFDSANEAFDFGNMLILCTEVELYVSDDWLERLELWIGMDSRDAEAASFVLS
jgi:hypothetical protein|tara:strand:- start:199 stop:462 length:264 start_codon:yes stop_codon:yes gene_type:complete